MVDAEVAVIVAVDVHDLEVTSQLPKLAVEDARADVASMIASIDALPRSSLYQTRFSWCVTRP